MECLTAGRLVPSTWRVRWKSLLRQRVRPELEPDDGADLTLARFLVPRRPGAIPGPQPSPFPARLRIVDAPVESPLIERKRVGNAQQSPLARIRIQDHQRVGVCAIGDGNVVAHSERVVLVHPVVIRPLGGSLDVDASEIRTGHRIERPTLRAMLSRRSGPAPHLALASVETCEL